MADDAEARLAPCGHEQIGFVPAIETDAQAVGFRTRWICAKAGLSQASLSSLMTRRPERSW